LSGVPLLGLTMGDPAGIGPELCLRMLTRPDLQGLCRMRIYGSRSLLASVASRLHLPVPPVDAVVDDPGLDAAGVRPGVVQAACGAAAARCVERAVADALQGRIAGLVTAPLHKAALHAAGITYPGHTEMLAALTGCPDVCMMMAADVMQVCLVTTHVAFVDVASLVTRERVGRVIGMAHAALFRQGVADPRITVCGLNPHAGEAGLFGQDEQSSIAPAVAHARQQGWRVVGPLPPDTAFLPGIRDTTDVYVAMYHDQGLIPFKMLAFADGVNVTLGLPVVRTSPDHGTAFDLAWRGLASDTSMTAAVRLAVRLVEG
jgi:4-phospho-D-threonate 3-dehydrogenase / 4-phospho-D-erythronate 3-dehydrogenase